MLAVAISGLEQLARDGGWLAEALAAPDAVTLETFEALMAFVVPGPDPYSVAQGESDELPGGVASGAAPVLIASLDNYRPPAPAATLLATLLNRTALEVDPTATRGGFHSPFARLSFADKARVFQRLERDPALAGSSTGYAVHVLPGLASRYAYVEAGVLDPATRTLRSRPVGWELTGYDVSDGSDELVGYWKGLRETDTSPEYAGEAG
jgi:hypothetical protein